MRLGGVHGLPAQDGSWVLEIAVAPRVARGAEEDIVAEGIRRFDASLEEARDVALAAPDGESARGGRRVPRAHAPDPHAKDRQAVGIGVVTAERLAPDLAGAVEAGRPKRRQVRQHRPLPDAL